MTIPILNRIGEWKFDNNADDTSGNVNNGTVNGATFVPGGQIDSALSYDGIDDFVNIPDDPVLSGMSQLSISVWVKLTSSGNWQFFVNKFNANSGPPGTPQDDSYLLAANSSGQIVWQIETDSASPVADNILTTTTADVFDDMFHHIVGTYDGVTMKVYLDGVEIKSITATGSTVTSSTPLTIGRGLNNSIPAFFTKGILDQVRIYSRGLTLAEVTELFNETGVGGTGATELDGLNDVSAGIPTKGKIIVGDGTEWKSLGVGANNQVITADSAQTLGVKWTNAGAADNLGDHKATNNLDMVGNSIVKIQNIDFQSAASQNIISAASAPDAGLKFNVRTDDKYIFKVGTAGNPLTIGKDQVTVSKDLKLTNTKAVKSGDSTKIFLQVTNDNITAGKGTSGVLQMPISNTVASTGVILDGLFGDKNGCMGVDSASATNPRLFVRVNGGWKKVDLGIP